MADTTVTLKGVTLHVTLNGDVAYVSLDDDGEEGLDILHFAAIGGHIEVRRLGEDNYDLHLGREFGNDA